MVIVMWDGEGTTRDGKPYRNTCSSSPLDNALPEIGVYGNRRHTGMQEVSRFPCSMYISHFFSLARSRDNGCLTQAYFGNSNGRASSAVNMHRALCPHSGTILTT